MSKPESFAPPIEVKNNARKALEYRAKLPPSKRGMTAVGIARARDLSIGRPQSLDTIQRMVSFFARHAVDKQAENWEVGSKGWQAWMGWGGDAGRRWAERILATAMKDESTVKKEATPAASVNPTPAPSPTPTPKPTDPTPTKPAEPEGGMAIGQLRAIADKATLLANLLTPESTLEPWVLSLISVAEYQVDAVSDYFKYSGAGSPASQTLTAATNQEAKKGLGMQKTLRPVPSDIIEKSLTSTITKRQKTFGGEQREDLRDDDFVIAEERKFPIMTAADVSDAVSSWGRYAGGKNARITFDTFKDRLTALATKKGFKDALPDTWLAEMEEDDVSPDKEAFAKYYFFKAANPEQRVVVGYASSERIDGQNDIVDSEALQQALDDYMQWANLREMHQPKAVGKVLQATPVKGKIRLSDGTVLVNPLRIIAKIVDEDAWQKVKSGILKGFSIGGKVLNSVTQKVNGKDVRRITGLSLNEISLVDRPANPDARIVMMKRDSSMTQDDVAKMVKGGMVDDLIMKAKMADPQEILPMIQQLRNQAEVDGDLDTAERYNEVITLMLEAMGIIPTGTVRELDDMESPDILDNTPEDDMDAMVDMEAIYGESGEEESKALKRRNTIMYADQPDDLLKIGRAISKSNMDTLADILTAANIIRTLCAKLGLELKEEADENEGGEEAHEHSEGEGAIAVAVKPIAAEVTTVEESMTPTIPASKEQAVLDAIENAPKKMMPGNNTGSPIHTPMNPNAPAQNVTGGYPIQRNAQNGDLQKQDAADAVDITGLEKEMQSMEQTIENAPVQPAEETPIAAPEETATEKADTPPAIDVSAALQDVIAKSLQGALAGTFAQLDTVAKAVERIETKSTESNAALTESIDATKKMVEPLVEKVSALEAVAAEVKALGERLQAIESQPESGGPVLRGQSVNKALGVGGNSTEEPQDEIGTLQKMIDDTHDPLVRTRLRERLAHLETKKALFGRI